MSLTPAARPIAFKTPSQSLPEKVKSTTPQMPSRARASTVQVSITPAHGTTALAGGTTSYSAEDTTLADVFDTLKEHDESATANLQVVENPRMEDLEQLPIEIRSFTERFLQSLSAKTYPSPLTIDAIAELYQEFYLQAEAQVATHIAARVTLLSRASPTTSTSPTKATSGSRLGSRNNSSDTLEQQMLTAAEIADRRRARRQIEAQKDALDESVERAVCEKLYDKIHRHRSTDDDERDAKLRSKTAALNLLGIGLKELHVNLQASKLHGSEHAASEINESLAPARESLRRMDDEHYPLGKLQHLKTAHKGIVETLAHLFPSSSSADEVLPTLIYTLITSLPDTLNVVSNLHFIQLFRAASRVDGETAYCLVNLEAAISFLENVDLSSLDTDQRLDEPSKPSDAHTLHTGVTPLMASSDEFALMTERSSALSPALGASSNTTDIGGRTMSAAPGHQRRLSSLLQNQKERIGAGRDNLINTADQALESINTTLESSLKFIFGRLQEEGSPSHMSPVGMPKTLDEARQLVSTPPPPALDVDGDADAGGSGEEAMKFVDPLSRTPESKIMDVFGGRRNLRERSVDSRSSTGSGVKHVAFSEKPAAPTEAVGSFVNSLNPLSRFSVPSFPRFGRSSSGPSLHTPPLGSSPEAQGNATPPVDENHVARVQGSGTSLEQGDAVEALAQLKNANVPSKAHKFLQIKDSADLRVGDVSELLAEYQRLARLVMRVTS